MSFSNTDTGSKTADPYTKKNIEEPSLKEKIEDLSDFVDKHKFCMMTTRIASSGLLASRCMAVAAKVPHPPVLTSAHLSPPTPPVRTPDPDHLR